MPMFQAPTLVPVAGRRDMAGSVGRRLLSPPPALLHLSSAPSSFTPQPVPTQLTSDGAVGGEDDEHDALVADVVSVLKEHRSRSRWGFLKSIYAPAGFTAAQAAQITLRLRSNPRLALRFFHWSEASSLCRHDLSSYATIVHVLARARLRSAVHSILRSAILQASAGGSDKGDENAPIEVFATLARTYRTCDSTPLVFDLLVRTCLQARRVDQAVEIVRRLRRWSIAPAVATCNELIRAVSKERGAPVGFETYEALFRSVDGDGVRIRPNVQTFNALLLSFHREGRSENAERILAEMEKFACSPNCFTYSILMADQCEEGKVQEATALWEEMAAKGIKPDATAYNTLIGGFCGVGETARAEELFREMATGGIDPTCTSYDRLVAGYCSAGDVNNALLLYDEMLTKGFRPEASTAGELIGELCKERRVEEGLGLFRGEMRRGDFLPGEGVFVALIKGLCRDGRVEEGLKLQAEMAGKGFGPSAEVYRAFIEGYTERGDAAMAARLKGEMLKLEVGLQGGLTQGAVDGERASLKSL